MYHLQGSKCPRRVFLLHCLRIFGSNCPLTKCRITEGQSPQLYDYENLKICTLNVCVLNCVNMHYNFSWTYLYDIQLLLIYWTVYILEHKLGNKRTQTDICHITDGNVCFVNISYISLYFIKYIQHWTRIKIWHSKTCWITYVNISVNCILPYAWVPLLKMTFFKISKA
jgi:hypothetical protein